MAISGAIMKYLLYIAFVFSTYTHADPYIPNDKDVIALSSKPKETEFTKEQLTALFNKSQFVGQTETNQGMLKSYLEKQITLTEDPDIHYFYARLLQREHEFEAAINILSEVISRKPDHTNAILLKANLLMVKGRFEQALAQCLSLFGLVGLETISTCSLDVKSQTGELEQSYQALQTIVKESSMTRNTRHVLAEMAYRLGYPEQTITYLSNLDLKTAPVSLVVLWADAQMAKKNHQIVLSTLASLTAENTNLEDAILLRLAQAEKIENQSDKWQEKMRKRVILRERRQDTYHASDLALYYLTLDKNNVKAKYWAEMNWQQAKLDSDKKLLALTNTSN